jgi:glucosylglycerate phosphorylase
MKSNGDGTESPYELNTTWWNALNREGEDEPLALQVDRFIASRAIGLALRGVPGIYLPSLFGARNDVEAVRRDGVKRSINRSAMREDDLFDAFAEPGSLPSRIASRFIAMLEKRTSETAFHPNGAQRVLQLDRRVFALLRTAPGGGSTVLCLVNVSGERVPLLLENVLAGRLHDVLSGRSIDAGSLDLGPYETLWLKAGPTS